MPFFASAPNMQVSPYDTHSPSYSSSIHFLFLFYLILSLPLSHHLYPTSLSSLPFPHPLYLIIPFSPILHLPSSPPLPLSPHVTVSSNQENVIRSCEMPAMSVRADDPRSEIIGLLNMEPLSPGCQCRSTSSRKLLERRRG